MARRISRLRCFVLALGHFAVESAFGFFCGKRRGAVPTKWNGERFASTARSIMRAIILMNTQISPIRYGALLCMALGALTACQTTMQSSPQVDRFAKADANHDGKLSRDEVGDYLVMQIFESRDTNHDGKLTWDEWKVEGVKGQRARFDARDTNHDGVVTVEEAIAYERKHHELTKEFKKADKNGNGLLTREEVAAFYGSKEGSPR